MRMQWNILTSTHDSMYSQHGNTVTLNLQRERVNVEIPSYWKISIAELVSAITADNGIIFSDRN
jgi:hypothetical protein